MFGKSKPIEIKSVDELALMREAGPRCSQDVWRLLRVGNRRGHDHGGLWTRSPGRASPATERGLVLPRLPRLSGGDLCTSVNEEVVHGIPGEIG